MTEKYHTVAEVAEILRVTDRTISRMIKTGKIKALNVSAGDRKRPTWRIWEHEIDRFMAEEYEKFTS